MSEPDGSTGVYVVGVDYTPEGILALRETIIHYRDDAMSQWPTTIALTVDLSHVIVLLQHLADMTRKTREAAWPTPPPGPQRNAALAEDIKADRAYWNDKYDADPDG